MQNKTLITQNKTIIAFARSEIKSGLAKCTEGQQGFFKRIYTAGTGWKNIDEMSINDVVDRMPSNKLDSALDQVERTVEQNAKKHPLIDKLRDWRDRMVKEAEDRGETMFCGKPELWFKDPHFMCPNGHVSGNYLKCEEEGDLCLECHQPVVLGPPMGEAVFSACGWDK